MALKCKMMITLGHFLDQILHIFFLTPLEHFQVEQRYFVALSVQFWPDTCQDNQNHILNIKNAFRITFILTTAWNEVPAQYSGNIELKKQGGRILTHYQIQRACDDCCHSSSVHFLKSLCSKGGFVQKFYHKFLAGQRFLQFPIQCECQSIRHGSDSESFNKSSEHEEAKNSARIKTRLGQLHQGRTCSDLLL